LKELEHKLDRLELDSLKDYIEKQMKKLKKIQKAISQDIKEYGKSNPEWYDAFVKKRAILTQ
jgi:chaperonin cofactor prefoldin